MVYASQDIHKAEPIVFIPDKLLNTVETCIKVPANSWLQWNPNTQNKIKRKE